MSDTSSTAYKAAVVAEYIARQYRARPGSAGSPLLVSMQGPQGAGKSTLADGLIQTLATAHGLSCAVASLDDFYLPYGGLKDVAERYSVNQLLRGRGPPGTHDVPLLTSVLARLHDGPSPSPSLPVLLPSFDKSQHDGFGDRSPSPIELVDPVDVFILEGWSLGYSPVARDAAEEGWKRGRTARRHPLQSILELNDNLKAFDEATKDFFDCHIAIRPLSYDYVYKWRLQQEHQMKSANGGRGMTDDKVVAFVNRYMPVYEVFGDTEPERPVLKLVFGEGREVVQQ